MKSICHPIYAGAFACAFLALSAIPGTAQSVDCAAVAERVATAVKANPDQLLTVVEDALVAYEECSCEVVSAAIKNSNGSADIVKQIVLIAVQTAETQAPAIAECAVAAAPQHAEAVRVAFAEAFNGKEAPVAAAAVETASESTAETATTERTPIETEATSDAPTTAAERADQWSGKEVVSDTFGGKEPIYGDPGYDASPKAPIYEPATDEVFGAMPLTLGSAFLIPPVSASPIILDDDEVEVIIKEKVVTKTRVVHRTVPRTIIRTVPVSPTSP